MARYYVNNNSQFNGDHEVHKYDCVKIPSDKTYLGDYDSCQPAVKEAKKIYKTADGCFFCCNACHTR